MESSAPLVQELDLYTEPWVNMSGFSSTMLSSNRLSSSAKTGGSLKNNSYSQMHSLPPPSLAHLAPKADEYGLLESSHVLTQVSPASEPGPKT